MESDAKAMGTDRTLVDSVPSGLSPSRDFSLDASLNLIVPREGKIEEQSSGSLLLVMPGGKASRARGGKNRDSF